MGGKRSVVLARVLAHIATPLIATPPPAVRPAVLARFQIDNAGGHDPKGKQAVKMEVELGERGIQLQRQAPNSPAFNLCDGGFWNHLDKRVQEKMAFRMRNIQFHPEVHNVVWFQSRLEDCVQEFLNELDPKMLWSIAVHKYVHLEEVKKAGGKALVTESHASVRKFWGLPL